MERTDIPKILRDALEKHLKREAANLIDRQVQIFRDKLEEQSANAIGEIVRSLAIDVYEQGQNPMSMKNEVTIVIKL